MSVRRRSQHPAMSTALVLVGACRPAIVGEWELEAYAVAGSEVPMHVSYEGYEEERSGSLTVDDRLMGEMKIATRVVSGSTVTEQGLDFFIQASRSWEARPFDVFAQGSPTVEVAEGGEVWPGGGTEIQLECTVHGDELDCIGGENSGTAWELAFLRME